MAERFPATFADVESIKPHRDGALCFSAFFLSGSNFARAWIDAFSFGGVCIERSLGSAAPTFRLLEPVAIAIHLKNVDVVGEPVEQRTGEPLGAEDRRPVFKGKIGRHDDRAPLVALAEDLEQKFGAGRRQGHVSEFVNDQELIGGELSLQAQKPLLVGKRPLVAALC